MRSGEGSWPRAAWGDGDGARVPAVTEWPRQEPYEPLRVFLDHEPTALSLRAATGFLRRADASTLRFADGFLEAVAEHIERMSPAVAA